MTSARRPPALFVFPLLLALTAPPAPADQPIAPLQLAFSATSVTATGAARGAEVYAFSVAREQGQGLVNVVPREVRLAAANDGSASWTFPGSLPVRSLWLFVDLTTGAYGSAAAPGYPGHQLPLTDQHIKKNAAGELAQLVFDGSVVEVILVRPGVGIWRAAVASGGALDESNEPRKAAISSVKLTPGAGTTAAAPSSLKKDDVVFLANSFTASWVVTRVGE
jgi:hypothetical protein